MVPRGSGTRTPNAASPGRRRPMAVSSRGGRHRSQPDPLSRLVGARVRRLRQEAGFTFDAFVEEVGLGRGYVSELERGLVVPSITSLARIALALEVTMADLVTVGASQRERLFELTRRLGPGKLGELLSLWQELDGAGVGLRSQLSRPPFRVVTAAAARRLPTAVPMLRLKPAASAWSGSQSADVEAWVVVPLRTRSKRGLFVAQVTGASMEPTIPDGAFCLFQRPWAAPRPGEPGVFARWESGDTGCFTLKEYQPEPVETETGLVIGGSLHARNPAYESLRHRASDDLREQPFARFVRVLAVTSAERTP